MTIQRVSPDDIETFTVVTNPFRLYASSSSGATGSVNVFARRSQREKETRPLPAFTERTREDANLDTFLTDLTRKASQVSDVFFGVDRYMSGVNAQGSSARKHKALDVIRFTPSFTFTSNTLRKLLIKDTLMSFYRSTCPGYNYGFTNYHSLNFFTASSVRSDTVLLYPNVPTSNVGFISGTYVPTGSFSIGFHINPRYTTDGAGLDYKAGTILHLSSTYVVSLVTGSSKDVNGKPNGFRLKLQLSHSADIQPSRATAGNYPNDLIFLSEDNSLRQNYWHDVVIRWGMLHEEGTGSFVIDGSDRGTFVIPSASIAPQAFTTKANPDALCVGNFYEGNNAYSTNMQALFFASDPSTRDGLEVMFADSGVEKPASYRFDHPLNAELHDVYVRNTYTTNEEIQSGSGKGPLSVDDSYLFYLPPFFTHESPTRQFVNFAGGVLQTPFFAVDGTTQDPFDIAMSFGVAGHYVNLENFTRDFATGYYPRALLLTASEITGSTTAMSCNDFLYDNQAVRKRNVTVLPCDDGNFYPNFGLIESFSTSTLRYHDDLGATDRGFISLDGLVPSSSLIYAVSADSGSMFDEVAGASPENLGLMSGSVYSIFQRTRDPSSNEVVVFDISNLYYGNRILPGTFQITDSNITGSGGKLSVTLRDDGNGTLYRADCFSSQSQWNNVGNVFYNEGLVLIKTPMLPFFGKDQFNISFKGEQNIHTMRVNVMAHANQLNSSSNPSYQKISASLATNQEDQEFVYLTGVNLLDDNLNVITKTQLAQPVVKRIGEKLLIRVKIDF